MHVRTIFPAVAIVMAACVPSVRSLGYSTPARAPILTEPLEAPLESPPPASPLSASDESYLYMRGLMVPVDGVAPENVSDTYTQMRDGGARTHHALDILAKRGTAVLAADNGTVLRLKRNALGGITIYAVDSNRRFVFYYAHLDRYAAGLREGQAITKGELLGYVGTTGNAPKNIPHLHFQVLRYVDTATWWNGAPVDARPFLTQTGTRAMAQ